MNILSQLLDLLFPRFCVGCDKEGAYICQQCRKDLVTHPDRCPFCHRVMLYGQTCYDCFPEHRHIQGIMVAFVYTTLIKKLIRELKFGHRYDIARFLGQRLALLIQTNPSLLQAKNEGMLFITFVPSHWRRKYIVKGYNQSELLATTVANTLETHLIQGLKKHKYTTSQTKRSRQERLTNLLGSFTSVKQLLLTEKPTIIIVDDITTTGATLDEVAKVRKKQYPSSTLWGVVVGRHGK